MLNITKSEPAFFKVAKSKVNAPKTSKAWKDSSVEAIRADLRKEMLEKEQSNLCVYCEKEIDSSAQKSHIDHFKTRNLFPAKTLEYTNLVVSCNTSGRCAKLKDKIVKNKTDYIDIVDPVLENPNDYFEYLVNGKIVGKNDKALKTIEILNLNAISLVESRQQIARALTQLNTLSIDDIFAIFNDYKTFIECIYKKL